MRRAVLIGLIFLAVNNPSSLFAIEECNVKFCRLVNNYEAGYGVEGVDEIVVTCIQGPNGATVSNQMDGEYIVKGTYKLGTFDTATISLQWGGSTSFSVYEKYEVNSAGEGSFTVRVIKTSGGSGNLYLQMVSEWRWMFNVLPVNTLCPGLEADFTATRTSGCAPLTVIFSDQCTGTIFSWEWDFGDGNFSTEENPSHTYDIPGEYTVSLAVTGPEGSDTETKTNYITVKEARSMPWIPLLLLDD